VTNRDDMVLIPRFDTQYSGSAQHQAREERRTAALGKKRSVLRRIAKARAARKLRRARTARSGRRAVSAAKGARGAMKAASAVGRQVAGGAGRAAVANPIGAIVAAVVVAAVVAIRLGTGRSMENMGAQVNKMLLGDSDEEARSYMDTRKRFSGDRHIVRMIAQDGANNSQLKSIFDDIREAREEELKGASKFLEDDMFQVNSTLDILILRAAGLFTQGWVAAGGNEAVEKLRRARTDAIPHGKPSTGSGGSSPATGFGWTTPKSKYNIHPKTGTWVSIGDIRRSGGLR